MSYARDVEMDQAEYLNNFESSTSPHGQKNQSKRVSIPYFASDNPNKYIVNASTGMSYTYKQGSPEAKKLFHVIDSTGFDEMRDPHHLYYNNPEEYMKHRGIRLTREEINSWYAKRA